MVILQHFDFDILEKTSVDFSCLLTFFSFLDKMSWLFNKNFRNQTYRPYWKRTGAKFFFKKTYRSILNISIQEVKNSQKSKRGVQTLIRCVQGAKIRKIIKSPWTYNRNLESNSEQYHFQMLSIFMCSMIFWGYLSIEPYLHVTYEWPPFTYLEFLILVSDYLLQLFQLG